MNLTNYKIFLAIFTVFFTLYFNLIQTQDKLKVLYEWKQLEFDYETLEEREKDINDGSFNAGYILPIGIDVSEKDIFISVPRYDENGIPVTFGTITNKTFDENPIIKPYPSWDWHRMPEKCQENRLVSVYRSQVLNENLVVLIIFIF